MKQSIGLIILQITGIVLGVFSVFYTAGTLPSEKYALVGIYTVISSFISVFSNTGLETHAIRNVLLWKEEKNHEAIKLIVTQSLVYRVLLAFGLQLPILVYVWYISNARFNEQYSCLFFLMAGMSIFSALNDSAALLLKSFNMYFASSLTSYTVNVFGRIIALFLFFKFGFLIYINFVLFLPLFVTIPVFYLLRKWISFDGVFLKSNIKRSIQNSKSFAFSAYISYLYNYLDQLLVSIFLSSEILGSFTVAKSLLDMVRTSIENIFDPIMQGLVKYKHKGVELVTRLQRIFQIQKVILIVSVLILPIFLFYLKKIVSILNLESYLYINHYIALIVISQIFHVGMKINLNLITLFMPSKIYLEATILRGLMLLTFFIVILFLKTDLIFLHLVLTNVFMLLYGVYRYKKNFLKIS